MGLATVEAAAGLALTNGPAGFTFSWGGTATSAATLASYAPAYSAAAVTVGQVVLTGGKVYGVIVAGTSTAAPTGTGDNIIADASAVRWCYLGAPNARRVTISNLDTGTAILYFGSFAALTSSGTLGTVGAPIPPSPGAWVLLGGDPSLVYVLGSGAFAVTVET